MLAILLVSKYEVANTKQELCASRGFYNIPAIIRQNGPRECVVATGELQHFYTPKSQFQGQNAKEEENKAGLLLDAKIACSG